MRRFYGLKDEERRVNARGLDVDGEPFTEWKKVQTTFAVQMKEPFEVETLEGFLTGKAGDWLAIGVHGEMYPIDSEVFEASYEVA